MRPAAICRAVHAIITLQSGGIYIRLHEFGSVADSSHDSRGSFQMLLSQDAFQFVGMTAAAAADGEVSRARSMACQQDDKWDSPN